jgi:hypothetical protein
MARVALPRRKRPFNGLAQGQMTNRQAFHRPQRQLGQQGGGQDQGDHGADKIEAETQVAHVPDDQGEKKNQDQQPDR